MKLGARELLGLLTAIRAGNLSEGLREQLLAAGGDEDETSAEEEAGEDRPGSMTGNANGSGAVDEGSDPENEEGAKTAPEREENENDRHHM